MKSFLSLSLFLSLFLSPTLLQILATLRLPPLVDPQACTTFLKKKLSLSPKLVSLPHLPHAPHTLTPLTAQSQLASQFPPIPLSPPLLPGTHRR